MESTNTPAIKGAADLPTPAAYGLKSCAGFDPDDKHKMLIGLSLQPCGSHMKAMEVELFTADQVRDCIRAALATPAIQAAAPTTDNAHFTPMSRRDTLVYLGRSGGFDLRDCPEPEKLAAFIVAACNAYAAPAAPVAPDPEFEAQYRWARGYAIERGAKQFMLNGETYDTHPVAQVPVEPVAGIPISALNEFSDRWLRASDPQAADALRVVIAAQPVEQVNALTDWPGIRGPLTDAQKSHAHCLYRTLNHLGPDAAEDVIRYASVCGYVNGRKDFAVPEGFVIAPLLPTEEMLAAGREHAGEQSNVSAHLCWVNMIAVGPTESECAVSPKVEPVSEDKRDAERYRKLRDSGVPSADGYEDDALLVYKGFGESSLLPDEIDAAVDALQSPTKEST